MTIQANETPDFSKLTMEEILKLPKKHLQAYVAQQGGCFTDANKPRIESIESYKGAEMVQVTEGKSRPKKLSKAAAGRIVRAYLEDPEGVSSLLGLQVAVPEVGEA